MAHPQLTLNAEKRTVFGRKVKALRRAATLPANIYGKKVKSVAIQVDMQAFKQAFEKSGETTIINLRIGKEKSSRHVLATNLQKDPVTDTPIHVDFHQVDITQKVKVAVPITIQGQSPAVKEKGAVLIRLLAELEVEALPQDLPDGIEVDISGLVEFDQSVLVKDLKLDKKLTVLADQQEAVVMVQQPKEEAAPVVEAPAVPEAEEVAEKEGLEEKAAEEEAGSKTPERKKESEKGKDG